MPHRLERHSRNDDRRREVWDEFVWYWLVGVSWVRKGTKEEVSWHGSV